MVIKRLQALLKQAIALLVVTGLFAALIYWQQMQQQAEVAAQGQQQQQQLQQLVQQKNLMNWLAQSLTQQNSRTLQSEHLPLNVQQQVKQYQQSSQKLLAQLASAQQIKASTEQTITELQQQVADILAQYNLQAQQLSALLPQQPSNDLVARSRQQAVLTLTSQITLLTELKAELTQQALALKQLTYKLAPADFEQIKPVLIAFEPNWQRINAQLTTDSQTILQGLAEQYQAQLQASGLTIAHWQGVVRLNEALNQLKQTLIAQLSAEPGTGATNEKRDSAHAFIVSLTVHHYLTFGAALLVLMLWRLVAALTASNNVEQQQDPQWPAQIKALQQQLSEQNQQHSMQQQLAHSQGYYAWSSNQTLLNWLQQTFEQQGTTTLGSWRQLLLADSCKQVIQALRLAKKQGNTQTALVCDKNKRQWQLAISFVAQTWQFSLLLVSPWQQVADNVEQELTQAKQLFVDQVTLQQQQSWHQLQQLNRQILLGQYQVLQQDLAFSSWRKVAKSYYQQQRQLLHWHSALTLLNITTPKLNQISWLSYFQPLALQQQLSFSDKKLTWFVDCEPQLIRNLELNADLFALWFEHLFSQVLSQVHQADIQLYCSLADQQKERGMLQLELVVHSARAIELPECLMHWPDAILAADNSQLLYQLSHQLFVEQVQCQLDGSLLKISCQVPITLLSAVDEKQISVRKLPQHHIAIVSAESFITQQLSQAFVQTKARVSRFNSVAEFLQQHMAVDQLIYVNLEAMELSQLSAYQARHNQCKIMGAATEQLALAHFIDPQFVFMPTLFTQPLTKADAALTRPKLTQPLVANVLFAAKLTEVQQQLLFWLVAQGANVTLASSEQQFITWWQSASFDLVFTEFSLPDSVLAIAPSSARSFMLLEQASFDRIQTQQHWPAAWRYQLWQAEPKHWLEQVSPWLLPDVVEPSLPALNMTQLNTEQPVLDLLQFAQRQGCIEVAAIMLAEYLTQLEHQVQLLTKAVVSQQNDETKIALNACLQLAHILAAKQLGLLLTELQQQATQQLASYLPLVLQQLQQLKQEAQLL